MWLTVARHQQLVGAKLVLHEWACDRDFLSDNHRTNQSKLVSLIVLTWLLAFEMIWKMNKEPRLAARVDKKIQNSKTMKK